MPENPVQVVARAAAALQQEDVVTALHDEDVSRDVEATLAEVAEPDFVTALVAPQYSGPGGRLEFRGASGFREAWLEWLAAFETYSVEIDEIREAGDRIVTLGRQRGRTRTGGVEIEEPAAAVWTVREGRIARVEFHLDREKAMRAAGLAEGPVRDT